ncbi:hypothetical protein B0H19DRAFT_600419 [Mycena capillaripes]|nr:hypothetical protein B0H19DRAFT_600419 [Mycena capillaripes]
MVSPDGMKITHDGKTVDMARYRRGLQDALADLKDDLRELLSGFDLPLDIPEAPVDKWTESERGYSFLNNHHFIPPDSFLSHLLHTPSADLTWTDTEGRLHFKLPSINRHLQQHSVFIRKLVVFIAVSCTVSRIAEFLDLKMKNSTRGRELFMHLQDLWIVVRRMKWENLVRHAVFVPHLVPSCVRDLLLRYIIIARPALVKLLRIAGEERVAILYDEYLWVADRQRISTDAFSKLMYSFTQTYCGTGLKPQDHRHFQVEVSRIFVGRNLELGDDDDDNAAARQRGHSGSTSARIYAREDGKLGMLTSDQLLLHRAHGLLWQQGIGMREGFPPLMPILSRLHLRERRHNGGSSGDDSVPLNASDAFREVLPILENMTATLAASLQQVGATLEENLHKQVARAFMDVLSQSGLLTQLAAQPSRSEPPQIPQPAVETQPAMDDVIADDEMQQDDQGVTALQLLRSFLGPDVVWRSETQEMATTIALLGQQSALVVAPTGGGKSLPYKLCGLNEGHHTTIVMCPNAALLRDQLVQVAGTKLTTDVWTAQTKEPLPDVRILFVALETLTAAGFRAEVVKTNGRVRRIFIDEAHQILTDAKFRPAFMLLRKLAEMGIQIIFLTATLALRTVPHFLRHLDMPPNTLQLREPFAQPQLAIHRVTLRPRQGTLDHIDVYSHPRHGQPALFGGGGGRLGSWPSPTRSGVGSCRKARPAILRVSRGQSAEPAQDGCRRQA